ncbi:hypothetical protein V5D56_15750 [Cellulosimicrobium sp. PMB13]|uniref:hypothetical protein n=1 Tax=Cellulosimicrobium sp. PMB13 TaxID=3120158 RepID=UPI003F4C93CF
MPVSPPSHVTDPPAVTPRAIETLTAAGWQVLPRPGAPGGLVARDAAGDDCTISVVAVPDEPAARTALVDHLHGLGGGDEHLVAVRAVVETGDGGLAVLSQHVEGLRLDELAAARGPFTAGEAVTVLVPVAQALAALHRAGRVHGSLDARAVVLSPDGRAVVRPPLTPGDGTAADDVRDLARLALGLVPPPASSHPASGGPPADPDEARDLAALHGELVVALREDPQARPAAGTFAARCYDAVEPRPVTMPDPARLVAAALGGRRTTAGVATAEPGPAPRASRSRRDVARARRVGPRTAGGRPGRAARAPGRAAERTAGAPGRGGVTRAVLAATGIVAGCVALVVVLLQLAGTPEGTPTPGDGPATRSAATDLSTGSASDPTADRDDPLGAAHELTVRHLALVTGGGGDLAAVVVPGTPAATSEQELLAELEGTVVLDAQVEVFDARQGSSAPADEAHVEVDYAVSAHRQRTPEGEVQVPATPRTTVGLVLRWTDAGWRVAEVLG